MRVASLEGRECGHGTTRQALAWSIGLSDALGRGRLSNQKATDNCKEGSGWGVGWNGNTGARGSPVLVVWWCLTGKNQTSKINITGKAWNAVAWTEARLLAASVTNEAS